MMTDKERIEYIVNESKLTYVEFSARTGISPATLSHITSGRSKPTLQIMRGILSGFPEINPNWMFLGVGDIYLSQTSATSQNAEKSNEAQSGVRDLFSGLEVTPKVGLSEQNNTGRVHSSMPQLDVTSVIKQTVEAMQRPERKITEVRIFFDDGTYEAFFKK